MDAQIEKVIAETVKEFGEGQASPAIRAAVNLALEHCAKELEGVHCFPAAARIVRSLADGPQKGKTT